MAVKKIPCNARWANYKEPTPYIKGTSLLNVYYMPHSALGGLVEVKSVQAGTHRVEHGSL